MNTPRLYVDSQFASPYAMSVFVALTEKGIDFQMSTVDLQALENQAEAYTALSQTQRVPTLVDGDFALSESSAITEYLENSAQIKGRVLLSAPQNVIHLNRNYTNRFMQTY